jgi:hypothetical protein
MLDQGELHFPAAFVGTKATLASLLEGVHQLAVHVELELAMSGIADANRPRVEVAGQPIGFLPSAAARPSART